MLSCRRIQTGDSRSTASCDMVEERRPDVDHVGELLGSFPDELSNALSDVVSEAEEIRLLKRALV